MRKLIFFLFAITCVLCIYGCDKVDQTSVYKMKMPVYEKMSSIRAVQISVLPSRPLDETGKIYIYKDYLFINEPMKGVHIYNNANPARPIGVSFIEIPGNVDMAIKDNVLYADSYVDLLVFDLSSPEKPTLITRKEDVFKSLYGYKSTNVIVDYKDTIIRNSDIEKYSPWIDRGEMIMYNSSVDYSTSNSYGVGGSMARFTLANEHLYTVDNSNLNLFDVSSTRNPKFVKEIMIGWGIETIFPYKDKLFIGSNTGMYIYDVSSASNPTLISRYSHLNACDPVVVNDDYAYVTLRTGVACGGVQNVLEVIDIKDLKNPKLLKSYQMKNPHGLALTGDFLYLCEGDFGLKSFGVKDVLNIDKNQIQYLENLNSTDVIPGPKSLIVIGKNGVCQYDYSNKSNLKLLSCISNDDEK